MISNEYFLTNQTKTKMKTKMMKFFVLVTTFLTLTVACSKKDDNLPLSKAALLGKWHLSSGRAVTIINGVKKSETTSNYFSNNYMDFRGNDSVYRRSETEDSIIYDTSYYKAMNNQIIITSKYDSDTSKVIQLSRGKLTVFQSMTQVYNGKQFVYEYTSVLTR